MTPELSTPKRESKKERVLKVRLEPEGTLLVIRAKGECSRCGEKVVLASNVGMWLHVERIKGKAYYDHEARPRRSHTQEEVVG